MGHDPPATKSPIPRRRFLALAGLAGLALGLGHRLSGYRRFPGWRGRVLRDWEAELVAAAAEALLPERPGAELGEGPSALEVAANVDRYLLPLPAPLRREIHGLIWVIEHATFMRLRARRFTRLSAPERARLLSELNAAGDPWRLVAGGIRDLCLIGWYQDRRTWPAIGYHGPLMVPPDDAPLGPDGTPRPASRYDHLVAPPGTPPPGTLT